MRWLLCHKAGLPTFDATLTPKEVFAWDPIIHALEVQEPCWEPGTAHGYHAITYGYLVGEVVRRVSGKSLGTFFHDEIAEPLDLEFWIGLPAEQEHRVAPLVATGTWRGDGSTRNVHSSRPRCSGPTRCSARALSLNGALGDLGDGFNSPQLHAAEMPAANGITNARSLARFYAALIGGVEDGPTERVAHARAGRRARARARPRAPTGCCRSPASTCSPPSGSGFWTVVGVRALRRRAGVRALRGRWLGRASPTPKHGIAGGYVMNRMMQGLAGDPRSRGPHQGQLRRRRRPRRVRVAGSSEYRRVAMGSSSTTPESIGVDERLRVRDRAGP